MGTAAATGSSPSRCLSNASQHYLALSKEAFIEAAWDVVGRKVSKERDSVLQRSNPRAEPHRGDMVLAAGSFFLCLEFCRTRFSAWDTRS